MKLMIPFFCLIYASALGCTNDDSTIAPARIFHEDGGVIRDGGRGSDGGVRTFNDGSLDQAIVEPVEMTYNGGPVITGKAHVYLTWYGDWSNSPAPQIISGLLRDISGSPYMKASTTYYQDSGAGKQQWVTGQVELSGQNAISGYSNGTTITENDVYEIIKKEITDNKLPNDPNGVYFFLASKDVQMFHSRVGFFCNDYCGLHDVNEPIDGGTKLRYAFVGGVGQCLGSCTLQPQYQELGFEQSPNGDWEADGMTSVLMHELYEIITDPDLNGWRDQLGEEVADKCAWTYGQPFVSSDGGSIANVTINGKDYLLQQEWVNDPDAGFCVVTY